MLSCFDSIPERDGQTDGRTDTILYQDRVSALQISKSVKTAVLMYGLIALPKITIRCIRNVQCAVYFFFKPRENFCRFPQTVCCLAYSSFA